MTSNKLTRRSGKNKKKKRVTRFLLQTVVFHLSFDLQRSFQLRILDVLTLLHFFFVEKKEIVA